MHTYTSPVDKLLTYSAVEIGQPFEKADYLTLFGIGPEHIPELIRMATDKQLVSEDASDLEFTAPLHAIRALAQLHALVAIEALLPLFDETGEDNLENEWMDAELIGFYEALGPVALPALKTFFTSAHQTWHPATNIAQAIQQIGEKYPESRAESISIITQRLENSDASEDELNGFLVANLITLHAVEAVPVIQRAYEAGYVDLSICGDWTEVQYELGLKERPARTPLETSIFDLLTAPEISPDSFQIVEPKFVLLHKQGTAKKAKSKMAKASRKKNRKK